MKNKFPFLRMGDQITYNGQDYIYDTCLFINGKLSTITTKCGKELPVKRAKIVKVSKPQDPKEYVREMAGRLGWPTRFIGE